MLLVGTANLHKLREIATILQGMTVRVVGTDILPSGDPVPERGETFAENARAKALAFARRAAVLQPGRRPRWVVADDSGLCVEALGGAPGVLSARYAGEGATDAENNRKLLEALADIPDAKRNARFVCTLTCTNVPRRADDEASVLFEVEGSCEGTITRVPRGKGGFGYDPVFLEPGSRLTFAEMDAAAKNRLSHRARALAEFRQRFVELLGAARPK